MLLTFDFEYYRKTLQISQSESKHRLKIRKLFYNRVIQFFYFEANYWHDIRNYTLILYFPVFLVLNRIFPGFPVFIKLFLKSLKNSENFDRYKFAWKKAYFCLKNAEDFKKIVLRKPEKIRLKTRKSGEKFMIQNQENQETKNFKTKSKISEKWTILSILYEKKK